MLGELLEAFEPARAHPAPGTLPFRPAGISAAQRAGRPSGEAGRELGNRNEAHQLRQGRREQQLQRARVPLLQGRTGTADGEAEWSVSHSLEIVEIAGAETQLSGRDAGAQVSVDHCEAGESSEPLKAMGQARGRRSLDEDLMDAEPVS